MFSLIVRKDKSYFIYRWTKQKKVTAVMLN